MNATHIVLENPQSKAAQEHLVLLKTNWAHRVKILRETVAGMTDPANVVSVAGTLVSPLASCRQTAAPLTAGN